MIRQNQKYISSLFESGLITTTAFVFEKAALKSKIVLANNIFTSVGSEQKLIFTNEAPDLHRKMQDFQLSIMVVTQKYNTPKSFNGLKVAGKYY